MKSLSIAPVRDRTSVETLAGAPIMTFSCDAESSPGNFDSRSSMRTETLNAWKSLLPTADNAGPRYQSW